MLEIKNLTVNYGAITALRGISFQVGSGDIVTLIGANGAGKTTALRAISGLLKTRGGEVLYQGRNIANLPAHQIVRLGISHVPEGRMVFANLTVIENLMMGAYLQTDKKLIRRELDYVFGIFPRLSERNTQVAGTLSGGEQQMLALARILRTGARLLLLDEVSEGLAPVLAQNLGRVIMELKQRGFTIVLAEQNFRFASSLADRMYVVERGRIVLEVEKGQLTETKETMEKLLGV